MALDISLNKTESPTSAAKLERSATATAAGSSVAYKVLHALASLKFTIVLFALAIFIVFTGTLAQTQHDIWYVIKNYFRMDLHSLFSKNILEECFVRIPFNIFCIKLFFPESMWPNGPPQTELGMWFPRGWLIGALMFINLLAAHTVRFSIQAKGSRLWGGLGVIAIGCLATWGVVQSGASTGGVLSGAMLEWDTVWKLMLLALTALAFASAAACLLLAKHRVVERWTTGCTAVISGALLGWSLWQGGMLINPDAIRILWQLAKATGAGLILLAGCVMVFKKRAGIVLLHAGVGVMFLHEFVVGMWHKEAQMPIFEGTRSNWVHDIRRIELAIIERGAAEDKVTAIPDHLITRKGVVKSERLKDLPFEIEIVEYMANSRTRQKGPFEPAQVDSGEVGRTFHTVDHPIVNGVTSSSESNLPAMFVKFTSKSDGKSLGTFLVGTEFWLRDWQFNELPAQSFVVDGKTYQFELRHERIYKPYVIEAKEIKQDNYLGGKSEKTKSYSSQVHVVDKELDVDRIELIRMNSPMRFADETFYQSGYAEMAKKMTTLSVVQNAGWMLPYVSCMIVAVGMLAQFGGSLLRFLGRQQTVPGVVALDESAEIVDERDDSPAARIRRAEAAKRRKAKNMAAAEAAEQAELKQNRLWNYGIPVVVLLIVAVFEYPVIKSPKPDDRGMNLAEFGKLPVAYESRVKPIDALARNTLVDLSTKQAYKLDPNDKSERSRPAVRWVLDMATDKPGTNELRVLRVDNEDLVKALGISPDQAMTYSHKDVMKKTRPNPVNPGARPVPEFYFQAFQAREKTEEKKPLEASEREAMKLYQRVSLLEAIASSFQDKNRAVEEAKKKWGADAPELILLAEAAKRSSELESGGKQPPKAVPLVDGSWITVRDASMLRDFDDPSRAAEVAELEQQARATPTAVQNISRQLEGIADPQERARYEELRDQLVELRPGFAKLIKLFDLRDAKQLGPTGLKFMDILDAYRAGDTQRFNTQLGEYRNMLAANPPADYDVGRRDWEAFLLRSEPFFYNVFMYLIAFCFTALSWLGFRKQMNRISFWIIAVTFVVHTAALLLRMYVTDRFAPVTNLYSSAVFIGWGCVLFGLILESVFKNGFGNLVASVAGLGALLIAWLLSRQGDTIENLEAVLDTTFWLATHVTCITLGYTTTFVAGILGAAYILYGVATPKMTPDDGKTIARMTYGILCFAIFFSFVGTVLGGLWADDSWGRFWGWDPKENGALIIVLWNALVLHARWDGLVKDRGLAVLAVIGNVTTSWSWFGVNQLGVGLHNYGFNQQLMNLMTGIVLGSLLIAGIGMLPKTYWWSGEKLKGAA